MPSEDLKTSVSSPPTTQTKESPLTDIATSPPPFALEGVVDRSNVESSELSDLGDEDSEAETDKMDFLEDDTNSTLERSSDLQVLSKLTELAKLKEIDDLDDEEDKKREYDEADSNVELKKRKVESSSTGVKREDNQTHIQERENENANKFSVDEKSKSSKEVNEELKNKSNGTRTVMARAETNAEDKAEEEAGDGAEDKAEDEAEDEAEDKAEDEAEIDNKNANNQDPLVFSVNSELTLKQNEDNYSNTQLDEGEGEHQKHEEEKAKDDAKLELGDEHDHDHDHEHKHEHKSESGLEGEAELSDEPNSEIKAESNVKLEVEAEAEAEVEAEAEAEAETELGSKAESVIDHIHEHESGHESEHESGHESEHESDHESEPKLGDSKSEEPEVGAEDENNDIDADDIDDADEDEEESAEGSKISEQTEIDLNEKRKMAIEDLIDIEKSFAYLRDKLYQEKLNLLEHELELCLKGSHPELTKIYFKINEIHQENLRYANSNLNYRLQCIDKQTVASRTGVHQDFLKNLMDSKNEMIANTTSLWYKINKERNIMDQLVPDYNYSAIPANIGKTVSNTEEGEVIVQLPSKLVKQKTLYELVEQRNNLNQELGIQRGLLEFYGFPSAISTSTVDEKVSFHAQELLLPKASEEQIQDDLKAMGIRL